METPTERRKYSKRVGYITGIIGAVIALAIIILANIF